MKKVGLNTNSMLGIDGPNVNLLFQNKLCNEFSIIDVGTCPLHKQCIWESCQVTQQKCS